MTSIFDQQINAVNIYRHSNAMLKHMPKKALKTFQNTLLCNRKFVVLKKHNDRRESNNNDLKIRSDNNIADKTFKFASEIRKKCL